MRIVLEIGDRRGTRAVTEALRQFGVVQRNLPLMMEASVGHLMGARFDGRYYSLSRGERSIRVRRNDE